MFDRKIRIFMSVVEEGSFSAAGKKLFMSQSAVSQQITHLEKELGLVLFDRESYRPKLTKEGQFYYREVKRLHDDYRGVLDYMNQHIKDHITIGFNCMFDQEVFTTIVQSFKGCSNEHIEFKYLDLGQYKEVFENNIVDAVLGLGAVFQHDEQIIYRKICDLEVCVGVSLNHPLANQDIIDVHELENEPIVAIGPEAGKELYRDFISSFYRDGMSPRIVKFVNTLMDLKVSIALNEGIGYLTKEICTPSDALHLVHLKNTHHHAELGIAYKDHGYDYIVDHFIEFYKQYKLRL